METKDYIHHRSCINLARNADELRKAVKDYRAVAKGNDLKDLNAQAVIKAEVLETLSSSDNRAQVAKVTYAK